MALRALVTLLFVPLFLSPTILGYSQADIKKWCSQTPNPEPCEYFLSHKPNYHNSIKQKSDFFTISKQLALERALKQIFEDAYIFARQVENDKIKGPSLSLSVRYAVVGDGFIAQDITIRNTAGAANQQAVALRSGSDLSVFYRCSLEGYQDTLYVHSQRQFYRECDIYGTVDFIFGNAAVVLQNCNIYARYPPNKTNTLTAQGRTDPNQNTGISIHDCTVKAASDLMASQNSVTTYLGRPWKEYSRTVFMKTYLDSLIAPAGWMEWSGNFALNTLYYGEYANTGPGSSTANRVNWSGYHVITSASVASQYTVANFISGGSWLPATNVPYTADL
ncbi:pectinesterase 2 [Quercus suber]|uniref:pectinesterase 2 n=1 Tax=Quercus suber TaxID=58331 RepID=UPI0032DF3244